MRGKVWAGMVGVAAVVLAVSWVIHLQIQRQASPWIRARAPKVALGRDGLAVTGTDRVENYGNAPMVNGRFAFYLLAVAPDDFDKDVAARIKFSDERIALKQLGTIAPHQQEVIALSDEGVSQLSPVSSVQGPFTDSSQADLYLRTLLTYYDNSGKVHHTNSCYQVEEGPNKTVSLFGCPFDSLQD